MSCSISRGDMGLVYPSLGCGEWVYLMGIKMGLTLTYSLGLTTHGTGRFLECPGIAWLTLISRSDCISLLSLETQMLDHHYFAGILGTQT